MNFKDTKIESRRLRKQAVLDYVKEEVKKGNYPSHRDLLKKFNIGFWRITLKDIYPKLGIDFLNVPFKRPNSCLKEVRKELIKYIQNEVKKKHYPSLSFIQKKFNLNLTPNLFKSTMDLYNKAGLKYKQKKSYEIASKKADILSKIIVSILPKLNLNLVIARKVSERGVDILAKDKQDNLVGIELKAINKYETIKQRNFDQLRRFIEREHLYNIILITTTDKIANNLSEIKNLTTINHNELKKLVSKKQLKDLEYIRNQPIRIDTKEREIKKKIIIEFVQKLHREGKKINHDIIRKNLGLFTNTYFGSIFKLYEAANIPIPLSKLHKYNGKRKKEYFEYHINKILNYMKEEINKGNKSICDNICKEFNTSIWKYISMGDLYNKLGLPSNYGRIKNNIS